MKKTFLISLMILVSSCASTIYNSKRSDAGFNELRAGNDYIFEKKQDERIKMTVTSIERDSIIGLKSKTPVSIAKNDIRRVVKNNTAGTVILVGAVVGSVVVGTVILKKATDTATSILGAPQEN